MNRIFIAIGIGLLVTMPLFSGGKPIEQVDTDTLDGSWQLVEIMHNGQKAPIKIAQHRMTFKGNKMTIHQGPGMPPQNATVTTDPSKHPKHFNFALLDGPGKGQTYKGIYHVDHKSLKICFPIVGGGPGAPVVGGGRPKAFDASAGTGCGLLVLRRVTK